MASMPIRPGASGLIAIDSLANERSQKVNSTRQWVNSACQSGELYKRPLPETVTSYQWVINVIPRTLHAQRYPKKIKSFFYSASLAEFTDTPPTVLAKFTETNPAGQGDMAQQMGAANDGT